MSNGRIYVGNLPMDVQRRDLEDLFTKYGKIRLIELKNYSDSAPFAFIQYEDPRDAADAVSGRNGFGYGDVKLRVEYPRESTNQFGPTGGGRGGGFAPRGGGGFVPRGGGGFTPRGRGGFSPRGGGGFAPRGGGFAPRGRGGPPSRRSEFRVIVTGLPPTGSWQDLKDHMREAGDVCYTDVQRSGEGVVEFVRRDDMEYAVRRLDRTEFRSHLGETSFIRVYEDRMIPSWDRPRSRSRSRGRYSPEYYGRGSPPPRYSSSPRSTMPRRSPPLRRYQPQYSPPSRHY
ncbi:serine/arginine-rich splicing factor 9 isoform X2 [Boleophthalmus pectinirostris]|nr:serine/arginine-rich splicing factor 9 isoform X2 [Boleophthalmus pectinirostris]XP_020780789.1 serine/arginine-rich splicing factor 9 isoform X2 [Boleophthalmus pectinirostris]XP_055009984.1 serine/arginine-rich splicing factor 9 isoform X2 [Boleophthalmus pectinirostris]